jgi:hypothetical protein
MCVLLLGVDKTKITPQHRIYLAGYADREDVFEEVIHDLYVRTFYFRQGNIDKLIVQGDLIWWGTDFIDNIRKVVKKKFGIDKSDVIFSATHTHSGPQTSYLFTDSLGIADAKYLSFLEQQVIKSIKNAKCNLEEVNIQIGRGKSYLGINRRRKVNRKIEMLPNRFGIIDDDVNILVFNALKKEKVKGMLVNYACHANVTGDNNVSSDYPGVAMEVLEKDFIQDGVAIFLQGFAGNIRPALMVGEKFFRGSEREVVQIAEMFVEDIKRILNGNLKNIEPSLYSNVLNINLQFSEVVSIEQLQKLKNNSGIEGEWSRYLIAHQDNLKQENVLEIFRLDLSKDCCIIALNGEVVVDYGLFLKEQFGDKIFAVGYTNGMIGYIPTAQQIKEGGYESQDSIYYFALPSRYSKVIEKQIKDGLVAIMSER